MANAIAVRTQHLSKKYRLFASKNHRLLEALHPWRRTYHREFWALRDINLEIPRGATVGILGLNGSGKSTLLQIISSVLQPSAGTVEVEGRVAALLELGAGFNPELTGRVNVVLNGTIMGLAREQITERMGSIERFADVGEFFDQPMRTYSSGMFMRVAFATAIHVDPEVLIIDEALSVGDAKFQEKCFRRFRTFQEAGKTILFVTHDRSAVPRHCDLGLLLHQGELIELGDPGRVVDLYSEVLAFGRLRMSMPAREAAVHCAPAADSAQVSTGELALQAFVDQTDTTDRCRLNATHNHYEYRYGNGRAAIIDYLILEGDTANPTTLACGATVEIYLSVLFTHAVDNPILGLSLKNKEGILAYGVNTEWMGERLPPAGPGDLRCYRFTVRLELAAGDWFLELAVAETSTDICDSRGALAHLYLSERRRYTGLARLDTSFGEITRRVVRP
jgi:lipopolysaccharide transport system ATP-binding protein